MAMAMGAGAGAGGGGAGGLGERVREGAAALAAAAAAAARAASRAGGEAASLRAEKGALEGRLRDAHAALEAARGVQAETHREDLRTLNAVSQFEEGAKALVALREKHAELEARLQGEIEAKTLAEGRAATAKCEADALARRVTFLESSLQEAHEVGLARDLELQKAKEAARQGRGFGRKSDSDVWKLKANRIRSEAESLRKEVARLRAMKTY